MRSSGRLLFVLVVGLASSLQAQPVGLVPSSQGVELSGTFLLNAYYNDDLVNAHEVPWIANPRGPFDNLDYGAPGTTVRQSRVAISAWASDVLGGTADGELELDFFGDRSVGTRPAPSPRLRRVVGRVTWPNAWLMFGQETLPISPYDPSAYSTVSAPGVTASGNLSRWMPQVRAGVAVGSTLQVGLEAAAIAPRFNNILDDENAEPDRAEQSKRPFVQGRLITRWSDIGEVSVGGHYGWFATGVDSLGVTRAAAVAAQLTILSVFEFRGEAFVGEGIGMLGGGGIDQTLGPQGTPVRTKGGWAQLNFRPNRTVELGGGYGLDDPENDDLDIAAGRGLNVTWELHGHLRSDPLVLAVEYRRIETTYTDTIYDLQTANHVNFALGFVF